MRRVGVMGALVIVGCGAVGGGAERSQVALGVYEVRDGLIRRVWYYPAER